MDCEVDPSGTKGGTSCRKEVVWNDPLGDSNGHFVCLCVPRGEICALRQTYSPMDQEVLGREAAEVVASGAMLPADGLFFVGFSVGERVLRWKCDGSIAGRIASSSQSG